MPDDMKVTADTEYNTVHIEISKDYANEVLGFDENDTELWAQFGKCVMENIKRNNDVRCWVERKTKA